MKKKFILILSIFYLGSTLASAESRSAKVKKKLVIAGKVTACSWAVMSMIPIMGINMLEAYDILTLPKKKNDTTLSESCCSAIALTYSLIKMINCGINIFKVKKDDHNDNDSNSQTKKALVIKLLGQSFLAGCSIATLFMVMEESKELRNEELVLLGGAGLGLAYSMYDLSNDIYKSVKQLIKSKKAIQAAA